ncbi:MAG: (1-_4)-alpha-D-glucan 1-alpha-D-glucosylmutase [Frankiaceae bacterium]|nr:(1->4)-alpha-D-glucan 1-alpha-D-glucosylmutase [Frankiaceae bacterium]
MTPTATYRLQLRREFGFRDAAATVPYLAALGVSHVYCSPVLRAVPGSAHGYDVVDHSSLSEELGGEDGWAELVAAVRGHGLGLVVDVVPNHMALPVPEQLNRAFWDVLRLGPASTFARWFDVDWTQHGSRLLVPVLGAPLEACIAAGEITIDPAEGEVRYFDHRLPLAPGTADVDGDVAKVLDTQHYLLADWHTANDEINYRRFFDVTSLAGLRVEDDEVFDATHARWLQLVRSGEVDGLRVDHPDGLAEPGGYLDRLATGSEGRWTVVEKILEADEALPPSWACAGTTGYDALAAVTQVLVDPAGEQPLTTAYVSLTGMPADFDRVVEESKRDVVGSLFRAEVARLLRDLGQVPQSADHATFRGPDLECAIVELLVAFDVYRAYAGDPGSSGRIDAAAVRATKRRPDLAGQVEWLAGLLRREHGGATAEAFAIRFEQTTGPVMAKGVEDTAFYRYHRLTALNEVGGSPAKFGLSVQAWHARCRRLARDWPHTMTTLSTHDTKRSEDVRARLLVLAEIPDLWAASVARWRAAAARHGAPDDNTDYLFWQTLVGAWPIDVERMTAYLEKATREAKQQTSWIEPDERYAAALASYVEGVFADRVLLGDVGEWVAQHLARPAEVNSLSQKVLQLTMPGVPDVYQGQELTCRLLVDPDNRRPVDYARRIEALAAMDSGAEVDAKLRVTAAALRLRREMPEPFRSGYEAVDVQGAAHDHVIAFARSAGATDVVTVATRLPIGLARRGGWGDTALPALTGTWRDVITGRAVTAALGDILAELPVALLLRAEG